MSAQFSRIASMLVQATCPAAASDECEFRESSALPGANLLFVRALLRVDSCPRKRETLARTELPRESTTAIFVHQDVVVHGSDERVSLPRTFRVLGMNQCT